MTTVGARGANALVATVLLLAGCASAAKPPAEFVWPPPPDNPRIRYVETYSKRGHYGGQGTDRLKQALLGDDPQASARMLKPYAVTTDAKNRVYVTDTGMGLVWVFDPEAKAVRFIGEAGNIRLATPSGIAVDRAGVVWVADTKLDRVFGFDEAGKIVKAIGEQGEFAAPGGLAIDGPRDRLYVADAGRHKIRVYDTATAQFLFEFGARGSQPGAFNYPTHLFFRADRLYVADTMNFRVQVFDAGGRYLGKVGEMGASFGQFARPKGIAVDSEGNLYVADAAFNNFQLFNDQGELLLFVGHVGIKEGEFWLPAGMHIDAQDRIYVVDQYNRRVQVFQFMGDVYLAKVRRDAAHR